MCKKFFPPHFDYVFKRIFGNQNDTRILTAFLMAALDLPPEDFDSLVIMDPHLQREFNDDKMGVLDVGLYFKDDRRIGVEIQVKMARSLRKRIAFGAAKMLVGQIDRGQKYQHIKPVISIVICGGVLLPEEPGYYNTYSIRNVRTGREFVDLMQINILEPAKLPPEPDGSMLFNWGQFFKAETPEELAMAAKTDQVIQEAVARVMELNEDEAERMLAEKRWLWEMDQAAREQDSHDDGVIEGREMTRAEFQPVIEAVQQENQAIKQENQAKDQVIEAVKQENQAKDRVIEELRRKLREAGIDA
jgi:predicted transposase/invertase (TIGR01784 family)